MRGEIMNLGPYELNDIYCGDSAVMLKALPDASIDLTVTSPPYDNLRAYNGFFWDFTLTAVQLYRVTKPGGVVVWVVGDATVNGSETGSSFRQALGFMEIGFNLHDTMIYHREGRFPEVNRYWQTFEYMFVFSLGSPSVFNPIMRQNQKAGQTINHTQRERDGRLHHGSGHGQKYSEKSPEYNVWKIAAGYNKSTKDTFAFEHHAIFPEELAARHITSWSNPGDIILDPFSGSGTTAKMAYLLDRNFLGFDISHEYVTLAQKRVRSAMNQPKLPLDIWGSKNEMVLPSVQRSLFCNDVG